MIFAVLWSASVEAADTDLLGKGFTLGVGTYAVNTDTTVRLDGETAGTDLDWEHTFGGGDANRIRADGQWRFAERHKARFVVFDFSRDRTRVIDEEIIWDDVVFPVDSEVHAERRFAVYELAYEYAFLRREQFELAASAGIHWTTFEATLSAEEIGGAGATIGSEGDLSAPLPVFGLRATWNIGREFWLDAGVQYFALSIDDYDGSLANLRAGLVWQPKSWIGLGIAYDYFGVDIDVESSSFQGKADWSYDGPLIFYNVSF